MSDGQPHSQSQPQPPTPRRRPDDRVGPVLFTDETARSQLLTGRVFTFRPDRRTIGETHARWERTGSKKADVVIRERKYLNPADPQALLPYQKLSGFTSVEEWQQAIKDLHGELPRDGWIYDVVLMDTEPEVNRGDEYGYENAGVWECKCGIEIIVTEKTQPLQITLECPNHDEDIIKP